MMLGALLLLPLGAAAQEQPPLPFEDAGACPFECCTYRGWEAKKPVVLYRERSEQSAVAYRAKAGEKVQGLTGVVVTNQYGVTRLLKPMTLGYRKNDEKPQLALHAGELLYTLHYEGEGVELFWYKGQTYSDQISPSGDALRVESRPQYDWWVQVKSATGSIGWGKTVDAFAHMDSCE